MATWGFGEFFWFVLWARIDAAMKERQPIFEANLASVIARSGGVPSRRNK